MATPRSEETWAVRQRLFARPSLDERILIAVAHPDDEVIGCGGQLARWAATLSVVHATDGSPPDAADRMAAGYADAREYAGARRRELEAALAMSGVTAGQLIGLEWRDQAACDHVDAIALAVSETIVQRHITLVIAAPYEGGHPDHDAVAWAVQVACERVSDGGRRAPRRVECTAYHLGDGGIRTGRFPEDATAHVRPAGTEWTLTLSDEARVRKQGMLERFVTQRATLRSFGVDEERFRLAPVYDFHRPPHTGRLFYEHFNWGVAGWEEWHARASAAVARL